MGASNKHVPWHAFLYMFSVSLRTTIFLRTFVRTVPGSTTAWPPLELRNSHARGAETSMESVIK